MNEIKTKLMVIRKYLEQLYGLLDKQLDADVKQYDMVDGTNQASNIRLNAIGVISQSVKNIEYELQKIEDAISLAEDMEKGLKVR